MPPDFQALSLQEMRALDASAFEDYVGLLFLHKGYSVQPVGASGDHGVDLVLLDSVGRKAIVQCKRYRRTVGEEVVRGLYGTLLHERATRAFLVTTAEVSEPARIWAQGKPLTLIDGRSLADIALSLEQGRRGHRR
jgi:restriction system protein